MNELQRKSLVLAKEFDRLCREHEVEYYLTAGSLIGALRHKGFIPWDDDVDIIMTRDNWEKLYCKAKGKLPNWISLNTQDDNEHLGMPTNHFVDTKTTGIYRYDITNPEKNGVMLDVIIMDPIPDNAEAMQGYVKAVTELTELTLLPYQYSLRIGKSTHFLRYWIASKVFGMRRVMNHITREAFHYSEDTARYYAQRFAGSPHFWPKEYYGKPQYVPFEDTMLPIPQRAGDCLCIGYDDEWMYVPSGGALKSTHEFCVRSLSLPSELIAEDFEKHIDRKKLMRVYVEKKGRMVAQTARKFRVAMDSDLLVAEYYKMLCENKCSQVDLRELVDRRDYTALEELFSDYIGIQCNSHFLGSSALEGWLNWYRKCHPMLIDIGDEALYAVLFLLMHQGKLKWTGKLLKARKALERPIPNELLEMDALYNAIKDARSAYECHEDARCREILGQFLPQYPDNVFLWTLNLKEEVREGLAGEGLLSKTEKGLTLFPSEPEILYLQANAYFELGRSEQALDIFGTLIEATNHGLVLLHIREKLEQMIADGSKEKRVYELWLAVRRCSGEEDVPTIGEVFPAQCDEAEDGESESATEIRETTARVQTSTPQNSTICFSTEDTPERNLTAIQEKRLSLLSEIAEICKENKIDYFLFGKTMLQAARGGKYVDIDGDLCVVMTPVNCKKFIKVVKERSKENRYLDSMEENPGFHRFCVRYCDSDTLDFDVSRSGCADKYGIYVTIEILRNPAKKKWVNLIDQMLEGGWESIHTMKWTSKKRFVSWLVLSAMCTCLGKKTVGKLLYRRFINGPKEKATVSYYLKPFWGKRTYYPSYFFKYTRKMNFEGQSFSVMRLYDSYLKQVYGRKWRTKAFPLTKAAPFTRIVNTKVSSQMYLDYLKKDGIDRIEIWNHRNLTNRKYAKVNTLGSETGRYWDIMCQCGERFRLWEKYMPMKTYLIELYRSNRIKELTVLLKDYHDTAVAFSQKSLGICFDKKIFEIMEYTLLSKGKVKQARKLRRLIPRQDWKPIDSDIITEETSMRVATQNDVPAILTYLKRHVSDCLYMYIDIAKYGLDNPNMKVWFDADTRGIKLVVMKYYTSISVYTDVAEWDADFVADLIRQESVGSVTGKKELIEKLFERCKSDYNVSYGAVYKFEKHHEFDCDELIEEATLEDTIEIAKLITQDEDIGGYYEVTNLADQLAERMRTNMGRSYIIREDGRIVAHIASYAEFDKLATTSGLIVDHAARSGAVYGSVLESYLVKRLKEDGFEIYTFVTARMRKRLLSALGNQCVGEYGKLARIKTEE